MNSRLSVLVTPRDSVPYQGLLYRGMTSEGVRVRYADGPTPSQTVNVILSPVLLLWWRAQGFRILHIHWLFQFSPPWTRKRRWARRLMEFWFGLYLRTAHLAGYAIVWTAHDLVPHEQIFADDIRARSSLLATATLVIALSESTAGSLKELGARKVKVIPHGPYVSPHAHRQSVDEARASFGFDANDVVVVLLGKMEKYKGADLLMLAAEQLPRSSKVKILLAGACDDASYRRELTRLVERGGSRVVAIFERVPEEDIARYLRVANIAAFPFREITNSGSLILAQTFGLPVMVSDLPSLADIPVSSAIRFDVSPDSLAEALLGVEAMSNAKLRAMGDAGHEWAMRCTWEEIARATVDAFDAI
jgi:glycosyltransferase involved in cell wall biosynthesis